MRSGGYLAPLYAAAYLDLRRRLYRDEYLEIERIWAIQSLAAAIENMLLAVHRLVLGGEEPGEVTAHVVTTLERVLRVFVASPSFRKAVMTVVEMGGDTDTAAALVGGLWGAYGGVGSIPQGWLEKLAKRSWVKELAEKLWDTVRRRYGL